MAEALVQDRDLLSRWLRCLDAADEFAIAMALVNQNGLYEIGANLRALLLRGGSGRFVFGVDLPTHPEAIKTLCNWRNEFGSRFELRLFISSYGYTFHPKLAIFKASGRYSAIVGSGNMTSGGLVCNYEASVYVDERKVVNNLFDYFDEIFNCSDARPVDKSWLSSYRSAFQDRQKAVQMLKLSRKKLLQISTRLKSTRVPTRIQGYRFAFTGGIAGWPRETELYLKVRQLGGTVIRNAQRMNTADCLVHGNVRSGTGNTEKLRVAKELGIPTITDNEFFRLITREYQMSK